MSQTSATLLSAPYPTASSYIARSEYESSTPSSFFGPQEVLYAQLDACDFYIYKRDAEEEADGGMWWEFLGPEAANAEVVTSSSPAAAAEEEEAGEGQDFVESEWIHRKNVTVFVGSGAVTMIPPTSSQSHSSPSALRPQTNGHTNISSATTRKAISLPYPIISIHATRNLTRTSPSSNASDGTNSTAAARTTRRTGAIYLQIEMNKGAEREDQDESTVEVLLVPTTESEEDEDGPHTSSEDLDGATPSSRRGKTKVQRVYEALCYCAELHPDPTDDDDMDEDDEMLDVGFSSIGGSGAGVGVGAGVLGGTYAVEGNDSLAARLAAGGWITSENAHEFEGEFPVAVDGYGEGEAAGQEGNETVVLGPGAGRRRTRAEDGEEDGDGMHNGDDETKWQRTG